MTYEIKDPDAPMTFKQGITIRNLGGGDVRGENLTKQQASERIAKLMEQKGIEKLPRREGSRSKGRSLNDVRKADEHAKFEKLWNDAVAAGQAAGNGNTPTPMNVRDMQTGQVWHETEGMCGFAWVIVKPGTSKFARWLKKMEYARPDSYYGGVCIWISDYNQSYERKEAHARAMARVFEAAGIRATPMSRLD